MMIRILIPFGALLIGTAIVAHAARQQNREITVICDDIKIVFEVADKSKWSLKLVTDKKGTPFSCQILSDK
jgi:hypothetical protein